MRLENINVAVRPRNPWEAMDLGLLLQHDRWRAIVGPWVVIAGSLFVILQIIFSFQPGLALLAFWWLKPALDRLLLFLFSQSLFASRPGLRETINALPRLMKTGLLINLSLLRLNLSRSFHLPVWQLEELRGQPRKVRIQTLSQNIRIYPMWLTIACIHLELSLYFGPLLLLYLLIPTGVDFDLLDFFIRNSDNIWLQLLDSFAYLFAVLLIEPLYVAAGFMLYTNRRAHLEAWDIELTFRQLANRLRGLNAGKTATVVLVFSIFLAPINAPALAATPLQPANQNSPEPGAVIKSILEQKQFRQYQTQQRWLPLKQELAIQDESNWLQRGSGLIGTIARVLRGALWVAVGIGILLLIINHKHWLQSWRKGRPEPPSHESLEKFFDHDIRTESLPADIPGAARQALGRGEHRVALGLLYRGALSVMIERGILVLRASHTEGDILHLAHERLPRDQSGYIAALTRLWQRTAYGHNDPRNDSIMSLCEQWTQYFGPVSMPREKNQ